MVKLLEILNLNLNSELIVKLIETIKHNIVYLDIDEGWKKDALMRKVNNILSKYHLSTSSLKKNLIELRSLNKNELNQLYIELKKFHNKKNNWLDLDNLLEIKNISGITVEMVRELFDKVRAKIMNFGPLDGELFDKVTELDNLFIKYRWKEIYQQRKNQNINGVDEHNGMLFFLKNLSSSQLRSLYTELKELDQKIQ